MLFPSLVNLFVHRYNFTGLKAKKKVNEQLFYVGFKERLRKSGNNPGSYLDDLTLVRQWVTGASNFLSF